LDQKRYVKQLEDQLSAWGPMVAAITVPDNQPVRLDIIQEEDG